MRVFIKPGCPWCVEVVHYLKEHGFAFEEIDVIRSSEAFDVMVTLSGQSSAPTMEVNGLVLADFGVEELVPFLEKHGLKP